MRRAADGAAVDGGWLAALACRISESAPQQNCGALDGADAPAALNLGAAPSWAGRLDRKTVDAGGTELESVEFTVGG